MLSIIYGMLFFLPCLFAFDPYKVYTQLNLPYGAFGPDSVALDRFNQGPYVAINDGRVLKYNGSTFEDFAYTSPNRSKQFCDGTRDLNLGSVCGRPFGFSFNPTTGFLFIVDAYLGLFKVGPNGGQATLLANQANGVPFKFLSGIDIDLRTGIIYFTAASSIYTLKDGIEGTLPLTDSTARLMQYNPLTREVKVLLQGLPPISGPAVSSDGSFLMFPLFYKQQVLKYWLVGPKRNTAEVLLNVPGNPLKIKRALNFGEFWVPINQNSQRSAYKFNSNGEILLIKDLSREFANTRVDVIQEYEGVIIYVGSLETTYVGIYSGW